MRRFAKRGSPYCDPSLPGTRSLRIFVRPSDGLLTCASLSFTRADGWRIGGGFGEFQPGDAPPSEGCVPMWAGFGLRFIGFDLEIQDPELRCSGRCARIPLVAARGSL